MHLKKHRLEQRCFLIEGPTAVEAALAAPALKVERIFSYDSGERGGAILDRAASTGLPVIDVDERTMRALSQTEQPQGVVAVAKFFHRDVGDFARDLAAAQARMTLVLHSIGDPGNAGTLVRSAEAFGASAVCFGPGGVDPYNEKVVRTSMGSIFHVPLYIYDSWPQLAGLLGQAGLTVIAAVAGAADVRSVTIPARCALIVGHERRGLAGIPDDALLLRIGIPQSARPESLNAAVAGSIALYEIARASGCLPTNQRTNDL